MKNFNFQAACLRFINMMTSPHRDLASFGKAVLCVSTPMNLIWEMVGKTRPYTMIHQVKGWRRLGWVPISYNMPSSIEDKRFLTRYAFNLFLHLAVVLICTLFQGAANRY